MRKIRAAVVGYGNIGQYVVEALEAAPDFEIAGIVRRSGAENKPAELEAYAVVKDIKELKDVDVAVLATPTRSVEKYAKEILAMGINTVDSFDIHTQITSLRRSLDESQRPVRLSLLFCRMGSGKRFCSSYTVGSHRSEGHYLYQFRSGTQHGAFRSSPCHSMESKDDFVHTIPVGTGIHRRMVYVELEEGADFKTVEAAIKSDPYFVNDETHVKQVPCVDDLNDVGHGVNLVRKGVSGKTHNQLFEFDMKINNPALTAQVLVCVARASMKQQPGCIP